MDIFHIDLHPFVDDMDTNGCIRDGDQSLRRKSINPNPFDDRRVFTQHNWCSHDLQDHRQSWQA